MKTCSECPDGRKLKSMQNYVYCEKLNCFLAAELPCWFENFGDRRLDTDGRLKKNRKNKSKKPLDTDE